MKRLTVSMASLGLLALAAAPAAGQARPAPTCAILADPARPSPVVPLLEARLLAMEGVTFTERAEIDAVLREEQLQALLGPEAGRQRASAGRVLKAELLILLRAAAQDQEPPALEVVV